MYSTSSGTEEDDVDIWKSPRPGTSTSTSKRARKSVLTPNLAASLDRAEVSDRKATFILASAAQSLGHDLNDLAINRSTIRKQFKLTKREEKGMRNLTVFVIGIYIKHWFTAPSAVRAPANDLEFLKKLES